MSEKEEKEKKWFPRRWGKRKVSEHLSQLNKKRIWVTIYVIDLYIVTIPCTVKKFKS
ncbi:hypothetical protein JDS82_23115 [Bacillus cereus group sp. N14]|uniref:hypothetical protein n=1 Tax=Bacillus cereus group sp. N14 TaxID=2794587 RepID=UPI0018F58FAE|nr:hypothetical protein [Bacillus cereus group sp. N14]MBJ8084056.1 hypothetical protein [Bacillus cereus group sp. N14]